MVYVPHIRLSMLGTLGGGTQSEIFSMNLSLAQFIGDADTGNRDPDVGLGGVLDLDNDQRTDIVDNCVAWFSRPDTLIHPSAVLRTVKMAEIGADGHYTEAPYEAAVNAAGGFGNAGRFPNQIAYAVSLKTRGDLGRVKGRFYVPAPSVALEDDGTISNAAAEQMEGSAVQFLNDLADEPGIDVLGLQPCVASQGRHNPNGTVRAQPANWRVRDVAVGQVLDTVRRRRSALSEQKDYRPLA